MKDYDIIVIGGGAAGFFGSIHAATNNSDLSILILEKQLKILSKVRISGGGRCNVTHDAPHISQLVKAYPRGSAFLKKVFKHFNVTDTIQWFESRGVQLKTESDGRMFPITDNSETIINCILSEIRKHNIEVKTQCGVEQVCVTENGFSLTTSQGIYQAHKLFIATGGHAKEEQFNWLKFTGHKIIPPVPSLFTFNISDKELHALSGIALPNSKVKIEGSKLQQEGALLITHWGLSGPAILKLSAWAARYLNEIKYDFGIHVHWNVEMTPNEIEETVQQFRSNFSNSKVKNSNFPGIPKRLWEFIVNHSLNDNHKSWQQLSQKEINKLLTNLYGFKFQVKGKTTFKEEFVTCGGISTGEISPETMESRLVKNLFFAGEIIDIDGVTGGFNFQTAWSTGYLAGKSMADSPSEISS